MSAAPATTTARTPLAPSSPRCWSAPATPTLVPQAAATLDALDSSVVSDVASFQVSDKGEFEVRTWLFTTPIQDSPGGRAFMRLKLVAE